jgi:deferrochelatase/peroxidase EfeB
MARLFTDADAGDTQALVKTAFGTLRGGCYLMLRVVDPAAARTWLRGLTIARMADIGGGKVVTQAVQIGFTATGLRALGHDAALVNEFAGEFAVSLAEDPSRARRLGDTGPNAPEHWDWGTGAREPHVLLMLFAAPEAIDALTIAMRVGAEGAGLALIAELPSGDMKGREPFGFLDGISQPVIEWSGTRRPEPENNMAFHNFVSPGEVLLGYPNEYGLYTERPLLDARHDTLPEAPDKPGKRDLGRNGSYLVFRQLGQDVRGFWRWVHQEATESGAVDLAEAMVGRRITGEPFAALGNQDIPGIDDRKRNGFTYANDSQGRVCPFGGHIRRANPRTGDFPQGQMGMLKKLLALLGLIGTPEADRIASTRYHRLLRRGREYGKWLAPEDAVKPDAADPQSGIHFICLNANLARQFEFVQGAWLASAKFGGMTGEQDPLLGNRAPFPGSQETDRFTRPHADGPCRIARGLPQFVTVKGGAYFFLPGLRAKDWLLRDQ